jgi:PAS domain-containing protein
MDWQHASYALPALGTAAVAATLAAQGWRRRGLPSGLAFALLMLAVTWWALGYALELGASELPTKLLGARAKYVGIVFTPVAWLAFITAFTGRDRWLTRRRLALAAIVPLATLAMVWTNERHGLFWSRTAIADDGTSPTLSLQEGPWFWLFFTFAYALLALGVWLLLWATARAPDLYRRQAAVMLVGALLPWIGNVLFIARLTPLPHLDLTPFAFTLSGLVFWWGIRRVRLLDVVMVAREAIFEGMNDGVLVLDRDRRIVDFNPAAGRAVAVPVGPAIGRPVFELVPALSSLGEAGEMHAEVVLGPPHARRHYDLLASPLHRGGPAGGWLVVLRDVTERKRIEEERSRLIDRLQEALADVRTLSGLLPICASCKKVRDDQDYWHEIEDYVASRSGAEFSHGICPDCVRRLYPHVIERIEAKRRGALAKPDT